MRLVPGTCDLLISSCLCACCQHLHISQLLQLCPCSAVWKGESPIPAHPQSCALPSARQSSLSSASEAASTQLSSCLGGSMAQLGSTAVRDHTRSGPAWSFQRQKGRVDPQNVWRNRHQVSLNREIYIRVFLCTGVATQV